MTKTVSVTENEIKDLRLKNKTDKVLNGAAAGSILGSPLGTVGAITIAILVAGIGYYLVKNKQ